MERFQAMRRKEIGEAKERLGGYDPQQVAQNQFVGDCFRWRTIHGREGYNPTLEMTRVQFNQEIP